MLNTCYMFSKHPYMQAINYAFHNYYFYAGLDQDFGVFSPKPRDTNPHLTAVVRYKDGTTMLWMAPRMERLGFLEKIPKERYRKYIDDNSVWQRNPEMTSILPDIARFVARCSVLDKDNPPELVSLIRYSAAIPPVPIPNPNGQTEDERQPKWLDNPPHSDTKLLVTVRITPEDLNPESSNRAN